MNRVHPCTRTIPTVVTRLLVVSLLGLAPVDASSLSPFGMRGNNLEDEVERVEDLVDISADEIHRALATHKTAMLAALNEAKHALVWLRDRPHTVSCSTGYLRDHFCSTVATEALEILDTSFVGTKLWDSTHHIDIRRLENVLVTFRMYGGFETLQQKESSRFFAFIFGDVYRTYYLNRLANAQGRFRVQYAAALAVERKMLASFIREKIVLRPLFVLSRQKTGEYDVVDFLQMAVDRAIRNVQKIETSGRYMPGQGFVQVPIGPFKQSESPRSGL